MLLEWLRRHDPALDKELRDYLFTDKPVVAVEEAAKPPGQRRSRPCARRLIGRNRTRPRRGRMG